eukprot:CAMPEP_0197726152 /NCGR_PEP_ID=MMETSP1434-20131217/13639_1 /TAXON_ID=265543 /ORGANISM="Minutocellus polymorphus, Strain CCMP3303" /LENGTH=38 /DNA_ID= /DNA_START= /DNA_END= /DNA_ORIENTATION=
MSSSYSGRSNRTGQFYDASDDPLIDGMDALNLGGRRPG